MIDVKLESEFLDAHDPLYVVLIMRIRLIMTHIPRTVIILHNACIRHMRLYWLYACIIKRFMCIRLCVLNFYVAYHGHDNFFSVCAACSACVACMLIVALSSQSTRTMCIVLVFCYCVFWYLP